MTPLRKQILAMLMLAIVLSISAAPLPNPEKSGIDIADGWVMKDDRAPDMYISVVAPTGKRGWYNQPVSLLVKSWDSGSGVNSEGISIRGVDYGKSMTIREDGTYVVYASATDHAGNLAIAWMTINVDMTPPEPVLKLPRPSGKNGWYVDRVPVALSATDNFSGVYETEFIASSYGGTTNDFKVESPGDTFLSSKPEMVVGKRVSTDYAQAVISQSGKYIVNGYIEDVAGNKTYIEQYLNVDLIPPAAEIDSPSKFFGKITLKGSLFDANSGINRVMVNTGNGWRQADSVDVDNWSAGWLTRGLKDGKHLVQLKVEDVAGNQSFTYYTATVLNNTWPFFAMGGVLVSMAVLAAYDPRRKEWAAFGQTLIKTAAMQKNALRLKKVLK